MRRILVLVMVMAISVVSLFASSPRTSYADSIDIPWIEVGGSSATIANRSAPSTLTLGSGNYLGFLLSAQLTGSVTGVNILGNCHSTISGGNLTLTGSTNITNVGNFTATYAITLAAGSHNDCITGAGSRVITGDFHAHKTANHTPHD